ncbi:alpha/beta fold hydrolase [Nocardia flavorosea]|uniref:Alpha/beta hydrolase n=2 Tax=Nocardia flavorosea TaxID=53429 RepID=A0A846YMU3_9NOCA|nr:alpha/beta hydrolase [Nocardia flavorosea]NKY58239.1 alpha/beta hydrolase [Nocardia flavorosea]
MVAALIVAVAVLAWLVLRDTSPVGHFDSAADKDRYLAAYDEAMREMPGPDRVLDVRTDYGIVRVYRYAGPPGTGDLEPFLLLPGTRSGAPVFAGNMPGLLAQRPVYALDLLGEPGMSVQDRPIENHADQARWLHEVLRALPEPGFHLLGLSIGGWTAANLAIHHPEKVASLILVEPVQTFAGLSAELVVRSLPASVSWFPKSWRDSFSSWTAGGAPVEDIAVARMIEAGMSAYTMKQPQPSLIDPQQLRALAVPVLVIIAGNSPMHDSAATARTARENLRYGTVHVYPGASHAINGEHPQRISADIAEFLAG